MFVFTTQQLSCTVILHCTVWGRCNSNVVRILCPSCLSLSFFHPHRTGGIKTAGPIRPDDTHHSYCSNVGATPHPHSHEHNETSLPRAESPIHRVLVVSRHGVDPTKEVDATNGNSVSKDSTGQSKLADDAIHIVPNALEPKKILLKKPAPPPVTPLRFVWQMCVLYARIIVWRARDVGVNDKTKRMNPPA